MSQTPFQGAYSHQHDDPRGLVERIEAQLRQRIEEAVDMAGLALMVDLRRQRGRPAPDTSSQADRKEFEQTSADVLTNLRDALRAELNAEERDAMDQVEARHQERRERFLAGQVFLARRLPDYWQRFETHQGAYAKARVESPAPRESWIGRLFRG